MVIPKAHVASFSNSSGIWNRDDTAGGVNSFGNEGFFVEGAVFVLKGEGLRSVCDPAVNIVGSVGEVFTYAQVGDVTGFEIKGLCFFGWEVSGEGDRFDLSAKASFGGGDENLQVRILSWR